jgi:hypothetical protein
VNDDGRPPRTTITASGDGRGRVPLGPAAGQPEDPFGDDVELDLEGPATDQVRRGAQVCLGGRRGAGAGAGRWTVDGGRAGAGYLPRRTPYDLSGTPAEAKIGRAGVGGRHEDP